MKQFYGEGLAPQSDTVTSVLHQAFEVRANVDSQIDGLPDDLAERLRLEELAAGSSGRGYLIIFD